MKLRSSRLADPTMRFFTSDRFVRLQSIDDADEADRADDDWERAVRAYSRHLATLRGQLPPDVRRLAKLCLHDAEFRLDPTTASRGKPIPIERLVQRIYQHVVLALQDESAATTLIYWTDDEPRIAPAPKAWPVSPARPYWLYDEIDVAPAVPGTFLHRILVSDGRTIEIPFASVDIVRRPVAGPDRKPTRKVRESTSP